MKLTDEQIEALLGGVGQVAKFAEAVRGLTQAPTADVEGRHLAAIADAFEPASGVNQRRRKTMLRTIFGTLVAKIVLGGVAAAAATGGLAAANTLPTPAQNAVSRAAESVGFDLPKKGDDANEHGKTVSNTARTTDSTGREKGQEVSETARTNSLDHRQDGEHRPSPSAHPSPSGRPSDNGRPSDKPGSRPDPSGNPTDHGKPSSVPTGHGRP